ncbi:hypothetical protein [Pedosphaera parvula]|uniref:Lipoprotein n=1 Tax=Pedosphaera parvula (strain Ellin514) TaxID=320771 RepID=B9XHF5_PEDPL|nr:hypothetical protein [Pedosphaera parvula]EEF60790.1 hypothetical protein Cflav_PD3648 [Pedosphaera parvula Ellin514]
MDYITKIFILLFIVIAPFLTGCASDQSAAAFEYKTVMVSGIPDSANGSPIHVIQNETIERLQSQGWEVYKCTASHPLPDICHYYYSLRRPKAQIQPVP